MKQVASFFILFFITASTVSAATLNISTPQSVTAGDLITARILVDSKGVAINNAEAVLSYPPDILTVLSVSKSNSIFTLWVEEPSFSNTAGTVAFNGGVPNPGFTGSAGTIMSVTFEAKRAGTATLSLSNAAVRANDGLGTDVLSGSAGSQITVEAVKLPAVPITPEPAYPVSGTGALVLTSPTHTDESRWYRNAAPHLTWTLPAGALSIQTGIGPAEDAKPSVTYSPPISEKIVDALEDGVWYFKARVRTAAGWGPVSTYRINIDSVVPEIRSHEFFYDSTKGMLAVRGSAHDEGSGIERYEITIDSDEPIQIAAEAFSVQPYTIAVSDSGTHAVTLTAFDAAGNTDIVSGSFTVPVSLQNQTFIAFGPIALTLTHAFFIMFALTILAILAACASWYHLWHLQHQRRRPASGPHKDILHRFEDYHSALTQNIEFLKEVGKKRDLTREERVLKRRLTANLSAFEKLLKKLFDRLE